MAVSESHYQFSLVFVNVLLYCILIFLFFGCLFIFNIKYFNALNELKHCNVLNFTMMGVVTLFLSLAGTPPFLGFMGKFFLFLFLMALSNWALVFFFSVLSFVFIFFYLQNIKLLLAVSASFYFYFFKFHPFLQSNLIGWLVFGFSLNIIALPIFADVVNVIFLLFTNLLLS
jgi:NADH:ubiquinone oxidoreductase subunit 2 (subunit N)